MEKLYTLMTALMFGAFLFTSTNVMGQNLFINGDFETGSTAPWVAGNNNTISIDSVTVHAGNYAGHGNVEQLVNLPTGKTYHLRAYGYNRTTNNTWLGIRDMVGAALVQNFKIDSTGYQYVSIDFTTANTGDYKFWAWGQGTDADYLSDSWVLYEDGTSPVNTNWIKDENRIKILNQTNQVMINIDNPLGDVTINVYSMNGQLVHSAITNDTQTVLDRNIFTVTGSYFVQVYMKGYLVAKQIAIIND